MTKTAINNEINALHKELKARGVDVKQSDVLEAMAKAKGFRNSHVMMASEPKADELHPFPADSQTNDQDISLLIVERDDLREELESSERMSIFDWRNWTKSLKGLVKHSHHGKGPISDETLEIFRLAVADNTCKSSSAERGNARHKVQQLAEKFGPGILARIDAAEEAAGKGLKLDGALLNKVATLYEINATRDGETLNDFFYPVGDEDPETTAINIAAKSYGIEDIYKPIDDDEDESDMLDMLKGEFDTFECIPATITLSIPDMVAALKKGEASVEVNIAIRKIAQLSGIDPRGKGDVLYPKFEG